MSALRYSRYRGLLVLAGLLIVTRVACRSRYLYDIDSINFALGMQRFDPSVHQPHPPGYFLYICLGRMFNNLFFHEANAALVAISIIASCGALVFTCLLAEAWFGKRAAWFAGLVFLFSPLVWFHGTVALTYALELFFASMSGYFAWKAYAGAESFLTLASISVAVAAGFRPSSILFLFPLLALSVSRVSRKAIVMAGSALVLSLFAWLVPMLSASGGTASYWNAFYSLWRAVPGNQTIFNSTIVNSVARFCFIIGISILCFGPAAILAFFPSRRVAPLGRSILTFCWVWLGPGLLFFTFIFLKFVNSGYLLILSPPVFALLGMRIDSWWSQYRSSSKLVILGVLLLANVLIYLRAPVYCSFAAVRRFENELESVLRDIPRIGSPKQTVIVGFDSHFLGYRHAGYYLPAYLTLQYPAVQLAGGLRIFGMQHRDTSLLRKLPLSQGKQFVFLPLPSGEKEYRDYILQLIERFPRGTLQTIAIGKHQFTTGSASDLDVLFPPTE